MSCVNVTWFSRFSWAFCPWRPIKILKTLKPCYGQRFGCYWNNNTLKTGDLTLKLYTWSWCSWRGGHWLLVALSTVEGLEWRGWKSRTIKTIIIDNFYIAPFSAREQTHYSWHVLVLCCVVAVLLAGLFECFHNPSKYCMKFRVFKINVRT